MPKSMVNVKLNRESSQQVNKTALEIAYQNISYSRTMLNDNLSKKPVPDEE